MNWPVRFFHSGFYEEVYRGRIDEARTLQEVEATLRFLKAEPGAHILDWCGGWGRHSVEFAKRGFKVTLLDFTRRHLKGARRLAEETGVELTLVCKDFRKTPASIQADHAVNLFTAGIGYLTEKDDLQALRALYTALKPGARFLLDTISLFWIATNYQPRDWKESKDGTWRVLEEREFDFWTNHNRSRVIYQKSDGTEEEQTLDHRAYSPAELAAVLRRAGFEPVELYGDFDGQPFTFQSRRLIMVSERR